MENPVKKCVYFLFFISILAHGIINAHSCSREDTDAIHLQDKVIARNLMTEFLLRSAMEPENLYDYEPLDSELDDFFVIRRNNLEETDTQYQIHVFWQKSQQKSNEGICWWLLIPLHFEDDFNTLWQQLEVHVAAFKKKFPDKQYYNFLFSKTVNEPFLKSFVDGWMLENYSTKNITIEDTSYPVHFSSLYRDDLSAFVYLGKSKKNLPGLMSNLDGTPKSSQCQ